MDVWLDKSELRGGDAWDSKIKKQIHDCALFVPLISAHTNARSEGYFHREWNLATRRLLDMAHDAAFLLPVVVDNTREADAHVPDEFLRAQWTWLPDGETPPAFAHRVRQLVTGESPSGRNAQLAVAGTIEPSVRAVTSDPLSSRFRGKHRKRDIGLALIAMLLILGAGAYSYYRSPKDSPAAEFSPPPHSVAVLAFTNMSGDPKDEYFSDGLSEELLNTLVRIDKLQVAARTSSFSFKGTAVDIPTVGRKLNVGAVLEGSVRKAGERMRITAQLINTVTGFDMWSQTFDRDIKDVLALQSEIATDVASALRVVLLAGEIEQLTDNNNPKALDAYLRGRHEARGTEGQLRAAVALFDEAIRHDPNYALAHGYRAMGLSDLSNYWAGTRSDEKRQLAAQARASAEKAVKLAPTSGQVYVLLANVLATIDVDIAAVESAIRRGLAVEPGNYELQREYSRLAVTLEKPDAIAAARRAVTLNPLDASTYSTLGIVLWYSRRYDDAREAFDTSLRLHDSNTTRAWRGLLEIAVKSPAAAIPFCEIQEARWDAEVCLAIAYFQVGRKPEAMDVFKRLLAENEDSLAYQYAEIYAQWGQKATALKWLETALRVQDPGLQDMKVDPLLDPIRDEPRFNDVVERLNFPK